MSLITGLKGICFSYIKFRSQESCIKFPSPFNVARSLRNTIKSLLITRIYQSSPETLTVEFDDRLSAKLHYAWLRDSCRCRMCIDPKSQQKLFDTTSLKLDITPRFCHVTEKGILKVVWLEDDGDHVSMYDPFWLHRYALSFEKNSYKKVHDAVPPIKCWTGSLLEEYFPEVEYEAVMQSQTALNISLQRIYKYGILFMRNVPCISGEVVKVMDKIANIKQTKWGSSFHITTDYSVRTPTRLTHIEKSTNIHTDMPYLEKSPGIKAIHCLETNYSSYSAETRKLLDQLYFVDGFRVAEWVKENYPLYFNMLVSIPVKFRLFTQNMEYCYYHPILTLNSSRNIGEVHFNNRRMAPLVSSSQPILNFYAAYKVFGENIRNPENRYSFSFKPGDLVILNNRRVLHGGPTLYFSRLERHLEGCFADLDEVHARWRSFLKKRVNSEK